MIAQLLDVPAGDSLRVSGSPIDIRGEAIDTADKMGVLEHFRARRIHMIEHVEFVDSSGSVVAELPSDLLNDSPDDIEIPREDLVTILRNALTPTTRLRFGESITAMNDRRGVVDVRFSSGAEGRYDLVVGADGLHSATRRHVFGPEKQFLRHLGIYIAIADLPNYTPTGRNTPMYNFPGHVLGITAYNGKALASFNFRSPWIDYDYHDLDAQKRILVDAFAGHDEWKIPELLDAAVQDPELYFDSISQIHMPSWHQGRIVLVGDAAHCASPLSGRGTSLALTGAWFLARAPREHPDDPRQALEQYGRHQRPHVTRAQATAEPSADFAVPATQEEIDTRNQRFKPAPPQGSSD